MALYQDGILISGANTLPKMTLEEYNALPADQRPTYWERTDGDYDDILANKTDIATVESGTTASRAYSVGELVYVSGTLYRVKTAIARGATFTVGTNVEVTNVSNFLNQFSSVSIASFSGQNITRLRGRITQIGNVCILIGTWVGSATNTTNILTLPTQYIPSSVVSSGGEGGITINGVYGKSEYTLNTNGTVKQAESVAAGTSGNFTFVYTL